MPIANSPSSIRQTLESLIEDKQFTKAEADSLLVTLKADGIAGVEANEVVEALTHALGKSTDGLDVSSAEKQEGINYLLGALKTEGKLGGLQLPESESINFVDLLKSRNEVGSPASKSLTFDGKNVTVGADGRLSVGDKQPVLDLSAPNDTLLSGLWALSRSSKLAAVDTDEAKADAEKALSNQLVAQLKIALEVSDDEPGKFRRHQAMTAALGALASTRANWDEETIDAILELYPKLSTPLQKSLVQRALAGEVALSESQKEKVDAIEFPETSADLLKAYDGFQSETIRAGYKAVKGSAAQFGLSALCFSKNQAAVDNVLGGMKEWNELLPGWNQSWETEEVSRMKEELETYVEKYPQVVYVYGTFDKNAPKLVASILSKRAVDAVKGQLDETPPKLKTVTFTSEQAEFIKTILPNVRDDASIGNLVRCLEDAKALFPANDDGTMAPAAFELFRKNAAAYQDQVEAAKDGKLTYRDFRGDFSERLEDVKRVLQPVMQVLSSSEPSWNGIPLSPEAATYLRGELSQSLRSEMTVDNLGLAIRVVGDARGGKIEGDSLVELQKLITDYKANWAGETFFDFNKLERIASYTVQGKEVPLCSINGEPSGLAEFYNNVALSVSANIDTESLMHPWMANRYGFRSKEAVEILDVVAEQTLRGEGPVAELRKKYPGKEITIEFTGRDGDHEQFIYCVKDGDKIDQRFAQGSDGALEKYRVYYKPVFSATIGTEGELNLDIPDSIKMYRYPIQQSYGVGDFIDFPYTDESVEETHKKGEEFQTRSKLVQARISGFTAGGDYTVVYTTPAGEEETKTVSLSAIRKANNPHWFRPKGDYFSDVKIDIDSDEHLKSFLEGSQPIIDRFLPATATSTMSASELAKAQKACIKALMDYANESMIYPKSKDSNPDDAATRYHELVDAPGRFPLGELIKIERGVCRHQCILEHLLLQRAGIDSRLASGAANTSGNKFRGFHIWCEVTLADGERFLSDQTWSDATIPLWSGAYSVDKRRVEMYYRTKRYDRNIVRS